MKNSTRFLAIVGILLGLQYETANASHVDSARFVAECDKLLGEQYPADGPGAAALVARSGRIIYERAVGMANLELDVPMRIDHGFRIGSIAEQFTAVAVLQLVEQGKLNLQDDLTRFIPDYPTDGNKITIENLLTHTSGIQDYARIKDVTSNGSVDFTPQEMIEHFKTRPLRFTPGSRWEYSNSGYFLLGYIIEVVTGKTYGEYLADHIFGPAGMRNTQYASSIRITRNRADGYTKGEQGFENAPYLSMTHPYAAGAIESTVGDLFKWKQALFAHQLIGKENLERALTRYKLTTGEETNYGYGWRFGYIQSSPSVWHGGMINGYVAMGMYLPGEDLFVAVFSNCDCNSPEDLTAKLAALAIGEPYEYESITLEDSILNDYVGVYENAKGRQRVMTVSERNLFTQLGRGPKTKLSAIAPDKFVVDQDATSRIEFVTGKEGRVQRLMTKNRTAIEEWTRVDRSIPSEDGIVLDVEVLEQYVGEYTITPDFGFVVTREGKRLFVQATGQEMLELFADSDSVFFLKETDAQFEFVRDETGSVAKVMLFQGGRTVDARKM